MSDLKPCPFCGKPATFMVKDNDGPDQYDIGCKTPGCYLEWGADWYLDSRESAAAMWNLRREPKEATECQP